MTDIGMPDGSSDSNDSTVVGSTNRRWSMPYRPMTRARRARSSARWSPCSASAASM